jgi:NAD(P)-dependent dehydrogenase (short-subunit alcohol dehydrogenase family)
MIISYFKIKNLNSHRFQFFSCLPLLEKASDAPENPSKVIIIGSISGIREGESDLFGKLKVASTVYSTSKSAVHSLAMNLAVYLT